MRYQGGKTKIAKHIAKAINNIRGNRPFWDPFAGGLSCSVAIGGSGLVSDINKPLISLYKAVAEGWRPPINVTEEEYQQAKLLKDNDPMKAFCGFGCSFGGKFFGGYARGNNQNYAAESAALLVKRISALTNAGCRFDVVDFLEITPKPTDYIIYCDPPYKDTLAYNGVKSFDHDLFWSRVTQWAEYTDVFVSEYEAPSGFSCILEISHYANIAINGALKRTEKLFHVGRKKKTMVSNSLKVKDRVVHTSLAGLVKGSPSSNSEHFPNDRPSIGIIVKVGYQFRLKNIVADICSYIPTLLSPGKGEYIELEEVDSKSREYLVSLSQHCRELAEELILHAERLEEIACNEEIIDDLSKFIEMRDSGTDPDQIGAEMIALRGREAEAGAAKSYLNTEHEFVVADSYREPRKRRHQQQPQERISKPSKAKAEIDIDALLDGLFEEDVLD